MFRLKIEVPPNLLPYAARLEIQYLEQAMASRMTGPGTVWVTAADAAGFIITAELDVINAIEHHKNAANEALSAVSQLGLYAIRLLATRTAACASEGLVAGGLGMLGVGASQKSELTPLIALIGAVAGGIVGNFVEREIAIFEWRRDQAGRWYDVQQGPSRLDWGWQPS